MGNNPWNPILRLPLIDVSRFLLVSLNIDSILQESTIYRRRERLRRIGDGLGLGDVYGATIERIKAQGEGNRRLGIEALMWVSHAERPLMADGLCHALAIELGSANFHAENVPSISTLISCCQGLITVDKEASTVRLIHFTLKEYLSAYPDIFSRPHSAMAGICLTYLNSKEVKALSVTPFRHTLGPSFLRYCSLCWGDHARRELSEYARSLALHLLQEYDNHISAKSLVEQAHSMSLKYLDTDLRFSGLHCASFFGIGEIVAALIEMGSYDVNEEDFFGDTPLVLSAMNGHVRAVKILLRVAGVNPDKPNNSGDTPLCHAAVGGHEEIVKILLAREEVNPDNQNNSGWTSLNGAAWYGHAEIVKILLTREEVNPDKPNNDGNTPLFNAARNGHEEVVKMLLEQDNVNPDKADNSGDTPLHYAAGRGHEEIVKILLAREGVNPDKRDNHGSTPLSLAAEYGHEDVVKTLLARREINPENLDNDGDTPLACAAYGGREGVVKLLLKQEGVNPDHQNHAGKAPLLIAARGGYEEVVKILLEQESVNLSKADNDGQTPLMHAVKNGHQRVIELLQAHEVVIHGTRGGNS